MDLQVVNQIIDGHLKQMYTDIDVAVLQRTTHGAICSVYQAMAELQRTKAESTSKFSHIQQGDIDSLGRTNITALDDILTFNDGHWKGRREDTHVSCRDLVPSQPLMRVHCLDVLPRFQHLVQSPVNSVCISLLLK